MSPAMLRRLLWGLLAALLLCAAGGFGAGLSAPGARARGDGEAATANAATAPATAPPRCVCWAQVGTGALTTRPRRPRRRHLQHRRPRISKASRAITVWSVSSAVRKAPSHSCCPLPAPPR